MTKTKSMIYCGVSADTCRRDSNFKPCYLSDYLGKQCKNFCGWNIITFIYYETADSEAGQNSDYFG